MDTVTTTATLTLTEGLVGLTDAQAARRAGSLSKTDTKGVYSIDKPIQFKAGEQIVVEVDKTIDPLVGIVPAKRGRLVKAQDEQKD